MSEDNGQKENNQQKTIIVITSEFLYSIAYLGGADIGERKPWQITKIEYEKMCPDSVGNGSHYLGKEIYFSKKGEIVLFDEAGKVLTILKNEVISSLKIETNQGKFVINPPSCVTDWILTKVATGFLEGPIREGTSVAFSELSLTRHDILLIEGGETVCRLDDIKGII